MTSRHTVLCLGEILLRLTPPRKELLLQSPELRATFAGAEANVAVALASFGHRTKMLSVLPDQMIAGAAKSELRRHGVDVSAIATGPGRMGLFYLVPGAVRRPTELDYDRKGSAFALNPVLADPTPHFHDACWLHVSGVTPALGRNCADMTIKAVTDAREQGLHVSFDGNYRSKLWESWDSDAPDILRSILGQSNTFFGDERDLALILKSPFTAESASERRRLAIAEAFSKFPKLQTIACTSRASKAADHQSYGAELFTRDSHTEVAPVDLAGIVDRIGTGDAFAAGIIHGMLSSMPSQQMLAFAHAAACLKHSIPGDFLTLGVKAVEAAIGNDILDVRR
ncbi:MAG: sugar kinase [Micropepsaceae bacterium]